MCIECANAIANALCRIYCEMLQFTQMALIVKSHARCKAGESERHLVSAWQARLEHSRVKGICHQQHFHLDFLIVFIQTLLFLKYTKTNGSRRTAIRAASIDSCHSQLHCRHGWRPLPQLFVWPEPHRSTWPRTLSGIGRREERAEK